MTIAEIIAAAKTEGGLDATDAQVQGWVNNRLRRLYAESLWRMQERSLGVTVAGTGRYAIPADVADIRRVTVGGTPYSAASTEELWNLRAGTQYLSGLGGVFAPGYDDTTDYIELWPVPDTAGQQIVALAAAVPADLTLSDTPAIPSDFHDLLVEGAIADGLARLDEHLQESDRWEARWTAGVERLRRRRNSRVGSGPQQIRVGRPA